VRVHVALGSRAGLTPDELDYFQGTRPLAASFNDLDRLVLTFAEQLTRTGTVALDLAQNLLQQLSPRRMVELTGVVAIANATCRIENALRIEEDA
jgi:alkylhydroperoxidase family enzyme